MALSNTTPTPVPFAVGVLAAGTPPYVPSALSAPLSVTQRATMYTWIQWAAANQGLPLVSSSDWATGTDAQRIASYTSYYQAEQAANAPITGPVTAVEGSLPSIGNLIADLENVNTWLRVAEFAVGFLLLAIAVDAIVKGTTGHSAAGAASGGLKKGLSAVNPVAGAAIKARRVEKARSSQYTRTESAKASTHANRESAKVSQFHRSQRSQDLGHARRETSRDLAHERKVSEIHARGQYQKPSPDIDVALPTL